MKLDLLFEATQTEEVVEGIFLNNGGSIAAAAARGHTVFAVSGAPHASKATLSDSRAMTIQCPISKFKIDADMPNRVVISNRVKLNAATYRKGAAINGTGVNTLAGEKSVYLAEVLRNEYHTTIPLVYNAWAAHTAVVACSNFRVVDDSGRHYDVHFETDEKADKILAAAENYLNAWADGAWKLRSETLVYSQSPSLTKSVARVPAGINDGGYMLLHDVIANRAASLPLATINSLFQQAISSYLDFDDAAIEEFHRDTQSTGSAAGTHGAVVGAAASMVCCALVSYRADGRSVVMPSGLATVAAESWALGAKDGMQSGDCDDVAILASGMLNRIATATIDELDDLPFANGIKNVLVPHYVVTTTIFSAKTAEASNTATHTSQIAGHAGVLLIPTVSFLTAIDSGGKKTLNDGTPSIQTAMQGPLAKARFAAIFTDDILDSMPTTDRDRYLTFETAKQYHSASPIDAFVIEGTTVASPVLHAVGDVLKRSAKCVANDEIAAASIGPTIGRMSKILHTSADADGINVFLVAGIEGNVAPTSPLWTDPDVRALGGAATQFCFSPDNGLDGARLSSAGVSPAGIATGAFSLVPMVVADEETAGVLDYASALASADVIPPPSTHDQMLDTYESTRLEQSLTALSNLNDALEGHTADGHAVAYLLSFNSLVNNPLAVEHFCATIKSVARGGVVDALPVKGLCRSADGVEAGRFVIVNVLV